eukprot:Gb_30821 [translate_table: standard]
MGWEWLNFQNSAENQDAKDRSTLHQLSSTCLRSTIPRRSPSPGFRCESIAAATTAATTSTATEAATAVVQFIEHEVQRGEWLYDIGRRHHVDIGTLLKANPSLRNPDSLLVGSKIKIPQATIASQCMSTIRLQPQTQILSPMKAATSVVTGLETLTLSNIFLLAGLVPLKNRNHRVVEGDSLEGIAEKYGTTVCALKKLNKLDDDVIYTGSMLVVEKQHSHKKHHFLFGEKAPVRERNAILEHALVNTPHPVTAANSLFSFYPLFKTGEGVKSSPPRLITVKVQYGDTLADISFQHGISIQELQRLNNLKDDIIFEGDVLAISIGALKKGLLELRHGQRRTNRILFSRQSLSRGSSLAVGGPEISTKAQPVTSGTKLEGKWKHNKKGFQQRDKWLRFGAPLTDGFLSSPFGWRWGAFHEGVDLAAEQGTAILASDRGTVTFAGWNGGYGYLVAVQHEGGFVTRYAHCCAIHARVGQQVQKGQHIAAVGATGRATGPHLHFEVRRNGEALDPFDWVNL